MRKLCLAALVALMASPAFATVTGNPPPSTYSCNGVTTTYTISFPYLATSNVVATVTTAGVIAPLALGTDFNATPSTAPSVGTLVLVAGSRCPNGSTLTISRNVPLTQPQSFRQGPFNGPATEQAFDRILMQLQQVNSTVANPVLPAALTNATPVTARGTTVPVQLQDWFAIRNNVAAFGADATGAADSAPAINAAVTHAALVNSSVVFPCGTYLVNTPISLTPTFFGMTIEGVNKNCVTIKANAAMTAVFLYTDVSANGRFQFRNLTIDGNSLAQYGIKSELFRYGELADVTIQNCPTAGMRASAGWDISVRNSEFFGNGDGFILGDTGGNDLTFDKTLFTSNTNCGLKFFGGGPVVLRGGAIQGNAKCGIYVVNQARPLVVDGVYFEANAATGWAFTSPVKTVHSDIIVNGTSSLTDTQMNHSFPSPSVTISNNLFNESATSESPIYAIAANAMIVRGNFNSGTLVPLMKTYGDSAFARPDNVEIAGNNGFTKDIDVDSITTQRQMSFSTWSSDSVQRLNYFPRSVYALGKVAVSSGTSVLKRGASKFRGDETFDVDQGVGDTFGITIDTTVNTELANALVYISAWAKASATTAGPRVLVGATFNTGSLATDTAWHHIEVAAFAPAAGTMVVGFSKLGAVAGDIVSFAKVTVAVTGAPDRLLQPDITTPVRWSTTAAPTTGTWAQGDLVWNSTPAAGGPPGWVCTTGGAPGTWKAMANVAP